MLIMLTILPLNSWTERKKNGGPSAVDILIIAKSVESQMFVLTSPQEVAKLCY